MVQNESNADRMIRVALGLILGIGGVAAGGAFAIIGLVLGAILLITGTIGFCPLYRILGLSTNRAQS